VILLDTHVLVWLAFDQGQLSKKARVAIDDARKNGDGLAISDITFWSWQHSRVRAAFTAWR
jgi:PIN domain nuclease of toxin-antitoxin system